MSEIEIGKKVKVLRLRDRVAGEIGNKVGQIGVVQGYKMTDGSGVGAVVQFDDKTTTWFFADELQVV